MGNISTSINTENIESAESINKKKNLYILLLTFQILLMINLLVVMEMVNQREISLTIEGVVIIQTIIVIVLNISNFLFIKGFVKQKFIVVLFGLISLTAFTLDIFAHPPLSENFSKEELMFYGKVIQSLTLCLLTFTFMVVVVDIFKEKHHLGYGLLGAANMYILIGVNFAFLYSLIHFHFEPSTIVNTDVTLRDYFMMSFYVLAGMDNPLQNVLPVIKNISVFESIFANLFTVMIVGRLLTK